MQSGGDIVAPAEVEEGSTLPIEVVAGGSKEITVVVSGTGEEFDVTVDSDGKARFDLPPSATAGSFLYVIDSKDPSKSADIRIVPATGRRP